MPIALRAVAGAGSASRSTAAKIDQLTLMITGALIIAFLIVEPHGIGAALANREAKKSARLAIPLLKMARDSRRRKLDENGHLAERCDRRARAHPSRCRQPWLKPKTLVYVPLFTYRTGPFAGSGTPIANGMHDYLTMLNERDGGIGGVKLIVDECETGYDTKKGLECYDAVKPKNPVIVNPWSTGITLSLIPKASVDKIPILSMAYGLSASAKGDVFLGSSTLRQPIGTAFPKSSNTPAADRSTR